MAGRDESGCGSLDPLPGAIETLEAAAENRLRSTVLRKNSAMMMAIARKPSRIAYSVVVWPSTRCLTSNTATCSATNGRIRMSVILEVPPPVRGATQPLHVTVCPSDFVGRTQIPQVGCIRQPTGGWV